MIRAAIATLFFLSLVACASKPDKKSSESRPHTHRDVTQHHQPNDRQPHSGSNIAEEKSDPCAPIYQHDEKHYTAGGLYAPHLSDSAPASAVDAGKLTEPSPKSEALARYGNKSPYTVLGKTYYVLDRSKDYEQRGIASWYGQKFNGRRTSSGEIYSICDFTAAHKTLPLPSYVRVTNTRNGKSVVVRVNDRGPFHEGRIIDLSYVAAIRIGLDKTGTAPVQVELLQSGENNASDENAVVRREAFFSEITASDKTAVVRREAFFSENSDAKVSLQFGSFIEKDNAKRLQDRLQNANIKNVEVDKVEVQGQSLWRVQLRALKNEQLADIFEKIRQLGLAKPKVIAQKL